MATCTGAPLPAGPRGMQQTAHCFGSGGMAAGLYSTTCYPSPSSLHRKAAHSSACWPVWDASNPHGDVMATDTPTTIAGLTQCTPLHKAALACSWKLSLLISASNCPIWLTAAAAIIHQRSHFPPTCNMSGGVLV